MARCAPNRFSIFADRVSCCGERGLLSMAFPPDYAAKGHFYVNYTDRGGDTVVARFSLTADPDVADPASEEVVLTVPQPFANHNGGQLAFGANDGYLYIGMGDGGSAGDPGNRGQNPAELLGKLLRSTWKRVSRPTPSRPPIRSHRPPAIGARSGRLGCGTRGGLPSIGRIGDLYIADVGQNAYEEVDSSTGRQSRRRELRLAGHGGHALLQGARL